ncbi:MAG TPA: heparan-alpha-glucosaminide N-acetyltransferase domain-containing protein [Chitinophagaceae bacterium]
MQPLTATHPRRIESIDLLRGLVMIIMALDHTRDFFHKEAFTGDPLDLATTTPFLYFTRWITHFCAPTFVFLSGLSAWLQSRRKTKKELSRFLITRGLWLVLVEITLMTFGITGDIYFGMFMLQTIWSIGISMVILGLVIWLPFSAILAIGLLIVLGHNSIDFAEASRQGNVPLWWSFLHRPTVIPLWDNHVLGIFYPFLPWTGLMMLGYCCGKLFTNTEPQRRNKILLWMGIGALLLFIVLRVIDKYGDPGHWIQQKNMLYSFLDFMDVQKYPPSLLYMCATIGGALLFLALVKNTNNRLAKIISVYGRVPFFYYILHFYLLNILHVIVYIARGHSFSEGVKGLPGFPFKFIVPGEGYSLWVVYLIWIAVVAVLYPVCKWYDRYKTNHKEKWWLSYL